MGAPKIPPNTAAPMRRLRSFQGAFRAGQARALGITARTLARLCDAGCSRRSETDHLAALKLTHPRARFHTGSAPVAKPLEVDFLLSPGTLRRWR